MEFKTLNGRTITRQILPSKFPLRSKELARSKGQYKLGKILLKIFSDADILEDFIIPETRLSVDFFIPRYMLAFEFDGIQHNKFNSFFHSSKTDFHKQKDRDIRKERWCEINNISLIRVSGSSITESEIKSKIAKIL